MSPVKFTFKHNPFVRACIICAFRAVLQDSDRFYSAMLWLNCKWPTTDGTSYSLTETDFPHWTMVRLWQIIPAEEYAAAELKRSVAYDEAQVKANWTLPPYEPKLPGEL